MVPVVLSTFSRRPLPESVANTLNQNTLLLTGAVCSSVSFLVGISKKQEEENHSNKDNKKSTQG
jgi:hypothetical protein